MEKIILVALIGFGFLSCKKEDPTPTPTPQPQGDCKCGSIISVTYPMDSNLPTQLVVKNHCTGNVINTTGVGMFAIGWERCLTFEW